MAEEIKFSIDSVKDDEGSGIKTRDSDKAPPFDYELEMNKWHCERLRLLCEQLEIDNDASARERSQRRKTGRWVAVVAGTVPVVALIILFIGVLVCPEYFFKEMNFAILFVASFSSMTVIYAFLIRGMFPGVIQKNDANNTHPVADEAIKVVQSPAGKE